MRWAKREPWIRRRPWPCIRQAATQTDASAWTVTSSQVRRCTNYCSPAACATYTEHTSAVADGPARRSVSAKILSAASQLRDNTSQLTQTIARHLLVRCSVLYHRRTCSKTLLPRSKVLSFMRVPWSLDDDESVYLSARELQAALMSALMSSRFAKPSADT